MLSKASDKAESKYNHEERPSKEDEEKYQKLLSDNEDLQRLIAQVWCLFGDRGKQGVNGVWLQKEEKIKKLRDRIQEREREAGVHHQRAAALTQGKDTLIVADFITDAGTSDSACGGCVSLYTRSSRCSQSDAEFSDSYL